MSSYYGRGQFPRGGGSPRYQPAGLPQDYLKRGYFDNADNLLPEVIVDWPKDIASKLASDMKTAQLRRFFDEARRIERKFTVVKDFSSLRPEILKLNAYAADAVKKNKAPLLFRDFIECNLRWASKDGRSYLKGFIPHFECVVAYFPETR